jgi:hypothetical protein
MTKPPAAERDEPAGELDGAARGVPVSSLLQLRRAGAPLRGGLQQVSAVQCRAVESRSAWEGAVCLPGGKWRVKEAWPRCLDSEWLCNVACAMVNAM